MSVGPNAKWLAVIVLGVLAMGFVYSIGFQVGWRSALEQQSPGLTSATRDVFDAFNRLHHKPNE